MYTNIDAYHVAGASNRSNQAIARKYTVREIANHVKFENARDLSARSVFAHQQNPTSHTMRLYYCTILMQ